MDSDALAETLRELARSYGRLTDSARTTSASSVHYDRAIGTYLECMTRTEALYRETLALLARQPTAEPSPETALGRDIADNEPATGDDDDR